MTPLSERMAAQVAEWDRVGDGRSVFLDCYRCMTDAVFEHLGEGVFEDGAWVERLLDRFADYYFDSIDGGPHGHPVPEPWVIAHAAAVGHDASTLQLLLAGVNAHINFDLVLTLVDVLDDEWASADQALRDQRRRDYDRVNDVIAATADLVQDEVVERRSGWLDVVDRSLGRWDERLAVKLLSGWRSRTWEHAVVLLDHPDDRPELTTRLERRCARRSAWLLI